LLDVIMSLLRSSQTEIFSSSVNDEHALM
jgi:hypothetical protein